MTDRQSVSDRRQFLKLAALGSATTAVAAASEARAAEAEEASTPSADYSETQHVKTYYRLARF